jgi:nitrogen fixation protein NifX
MALQRRLRVLATTPEPEPPGSLRVAFATADRRVVDQHFGETPAFAIYCLSVAGAHLVEVAEFAPAGPGHDEDKLAARLDTLAGCALVYANAVGGSAVRRLRAEGVQPVKVAERASIPALVEGLRADLRDGALWLAEVCARRRSKDPDRFLAMEAEGWEE